MRHLDLITPAELKRKLLTCLGIGVATGMAAAVAQGADGAGAGMRGALPGPGAVAMVGAAIVALWAAANRLRFPRRSVQNDGLEELLTIREALDAHTSVVITDHDARILYANARFCEVTGYPAAELVGNRMNLLNSGTHPPEFFGHLWQTITRGDTWHGEICNRSKSGRLYWVDATIRPFGSGTGSARRYISIRTDITAQKLAEASLREAGLRLDLALDAAGLALWEVDLKRQTVFASERFGEIRGDDRNDVHLSLEAYRSLVHPDDLERYYASGMATLRGIDARLNVEYRIRRRDGTWRWLQVTGRVIERDADGRARRLTGLVADIQERKDAEQRLHESEAFLHGILDGIADPVFVKNEQHSWVHVNRAFASLFGVTPADMIGRTDHDFMSKDRAEAAWQSDDALLQGLPEVIAQREYVRADGVPIFLEIRKSLFRDPSGRALIVGTNRDITSLRAARDAAETANRAKSDFLANMSHEIRTPMNGIIGMAQLALDTDLDATQREYLNTVRASAEALLGIIDDVLDFSKIEAGKMALERIDFRLSDVIRDAARVVAVRAAEKGIALDIAIAPDLPEYVSGDPTRLKQVLLNLVGNAVKFTHRGGVTVSAAPAGTEGTNLAVRFEITDSGIGIPEDKLDLIFEAFAQADASTTRQYGGTGLGLSISSRIVRMMGGEISVASRPGSGSRFAVVVPFAAGATAAAPVAPPNGLSAWEVVLAGGSAFARNVLERTLIHWGACLRDANDLDAALADRARPQLWIVDCEDIPDSLASRLLSAHEGGSIRCVGLHTPGRLPGPGVLRHDALVMKPAGPVDLRAAIEAALAPSEPIATTTDAAPRERRAAQPLDILLVEDNAVNRQVATLLLEKLGHRVALAGNGEEALAAIARRRPDVMLTDVQMPVMGGIEATLVLRERERSEQAPRLPVIALTASAMSGDRDQCLAAGMDDYLPKPLDFAAVQRALERIASQVAPDRAGPAPAQTPRVFVPEAALRATAGDRDLLDEVIDVARIELPKQMAALRGALATSDAVAARRHAHTLKGTAATVGARLARDAAHAVERAAADGDLAEARHGIEALHALISILGGELAAYRAHGQGTASPLP